MSIMFILILDKEQKYTTDDGGVFLLPRFSASLSCERPAKRSSLFRDCSDYERNILPCAPEIMHRDYCRTNDYSLSFL